MARNVLRSLLLAGLIAGCAAVQTPDVSQAKSAYSAPPKLTTETLEVITARGPVRFTVEVAADPASREYGLMYRRSMPERRGMIFDFGTPQNTAFWMRNTFIPLDMLFVTAEGRVLTIARNAKPHDERAIVSGGPIRAVIEINGGLADRLGIREGDQVRDARVFGNG